jgi:hypothetical protein
MVEEGFMGVRPGCKPCRRTAKETTVMLPSPITT